MPRKRNPENVGLPPRSRWSHGKIFYLVPPGQERHWDGKKQFLLGSNLTEAMDVYLERVKRTEKSEKVSITYIHQLLDEYLREVVPKAKSARTRSNKIDAIPRLKRVFGHMRLADFRPTDVYAYVEKRTNDRTGKPALTAGHREMEVLLHAFTWAVRWGLLDKHPVQRNDVRLDGDLAPHTRDRYVENWELAEALSLPHFRKKGSVRMIQAYIRVKLRTGLRMTDLLLLRPADFDEVGIHVKPHKTANSSGVRQIFTWLDADGKDTGLRAAVDAALAARPLDIAPWLFCTDDGGCYFDEQTGRTDSFESVWHRFMDRVLKETKVKERFAERDLRAKAGSDLEEIHEAQKLLGHTDARITNEFYRRKPQIVRPAKPQVS